ncbi:MAG: hypothetical protein FWE17_01605 [Alphaproteobacteria bacterium]|nr:hypothetical protein [Alphaproteobacteria bacterium]MCL2758107.1 hypothetical protein [Alphaproteobacteria bacterium]
MPAWFILKLPDTNTVDKSPQYMTLSALMAKLGDVFLVGRSLAEWPAPDRSVR